MCLNITELDSRSFFVTSDDSNTLWTLREMLEANRGDVELTKWLVTAKVGDERRNGGGAAPLIVTRRAS